MDRESALPAAFAVRFRDRALGYLPAGFLSELNALAERERALVLPKIQSAIRSLMKNPGPSDLAAFAEQVEEYRETYQASPGRIEGRRLFGEEARRLGGDFRLSDREVETFCARFFDQAFTTTLRQEATNALRETGIPGAALRRQLPDYFAAPASAADFTLRRPDGRDFFLSAANEAGHVR